MAGPLVDRDHLGLGTTDLTWPRPGPPPAAARRTSDWKLFGTAPKTVRRAREVLNFQEESTRNDSSALRPTDAR